ncbi:MAG TPA: site-2 protease family protein [Vicinamibacteria bacterium]|nr:site-2 protease family protein [Vicinamibacteria bacterium]
MLRLLGGLVIIPVFLCELALLTNRPFSAWAIVNIALYPLILIISIVLHEAGHAVVARAVGLQVPRVQIGIGRPVARRQWGQTMVVLNAFPLMGLTYLGAQSLKGLKGRLWVSIAAGPAVTLAIIASTLAWREGLHVGDIALPYAAVASRFSLRELVGFSNLWMLVLNLVPLPLFRSRGIQRNDGGQLFKVPFLSVPQLEVYRVVTVLLDVQESSERDDHEGARRKLEAALIRFPGSWTLLNAQAFLQIKLELLIEARASLLNLLQAEPPYPEMRWAARNNLAWVDYRLREDEFRDEADAHSEAVFRLYKNVPWAMGTRGAVLSWLGRDKEALPLLKRAYSANSELSMRALNAAGLAIVLANLGRTREAGQWLDRARTNHAICPLLVEARAAISAATSKKSPTSPNERHSTEP